MMTFQNDHISKLLAVYIKGTSFISICLFSLYEQEFVTGSDVKNIICSYFIPLPSISSYSVSQFSRYETLFGGDHNH